MNDGAFKQWLGTETSKCIDNAKKEIENILFNESSDSEEVVDHEHTCTKQDVENRIMPKCDICGEWSGEFNI